MESKQASPTIFRTDGTNVISAPAYPQDYATKLLRRLKSSKIEQVATFCRKLFETSREIVVKANKVGSPGQLRTFPMLPGTTVEVIRLKRFAHDRRSSG